MHNRFLNTVAALVALPLLLLTSPVHAQAQRVYTESKTIGEMAKVAKFAGVMNVYGRFCTPLHWAVRGLTDQAEAAVGLLAALAAWEAANEMRLALGPDAFCKYVREDTIKRVGVEP